MNKTKGLIMINTGPGKGKTTSALGAASRAAGQGLRVLMIQFIKGGRDYGELDFFEPCPKVEIRPMGLGLIGGDKDLEPHRRAARRAWQSALDEIGSGKWDILILDEVFLALKRGFLEQEELAAFMREKPMETHLILTGRHCPEELFGLADTVTIMTEVKHHLAAGIRSQPGVEY